MFAVPPDAGVTILVFFAENGDLNEGYWFAVSQEAPSIVSGGAADTAKADGSGQGEGVFKDVPSAKVRPITLRDAVKTEPAEQENSNKNANGKSRYILR